MTVSRLETVISWFAITVSRRANNFKGSSAWRKGYSAWIKEHSDWIKRGSARIKRCSDRVGGITDCATLPRDIKKKEDCDSHHNLPSRVGITGLEPATSRPPDVCATNCAKSRTCGCKGTYLLRNNQTFTLLFSKIPLFLMFVCCFCSLHGAGGTSGRRRGTLHGCEDNLQRHGDDERRRPILKISKKMVFILYCLHFALTLCYYIYNKVDAGALVVLLRLAKRTMQYETDIPLHADGSARAHLRRLLE